MDGTFNTSIASKEVDFGKQASEYAKWRPGLPECFYEKLDIKLRKHFGDSYIDSSNFTMLDLGCGPGIVSLKWLQKYPKHTIIGMDISENQINEAQKIYENMKKNSTHENKINPNVTFMVGKAENLQKIKNNDIDIIICAQCWPWFNKSIAIPEMLRILKKEKNDACVVIVQYCYLPKECKYAGMTEDLILKFNPNWKHKGGNGLYPTQIDDISRPGCFFLCFFLLFCFA